MRCGKIVFFDIQEKVMMFWKRMGWHPMIVPSNTGISRSDDCGFVTEAGTILLTVTFYFYFRF